MDGWNATFLLGRPIFVSFREGSQQGDMFWFHFGSASTRQTRPHLHRTGKGIDQEMRHASLAAGWCCVLLIRGDWVQIGKGLLCGGYAKNATLEEHPGLRKIRKTNDDANDHWNSI